MRIVITDGYTLNPGDLDWKPFTELGEVEYFDRTLVADVLERCRDAGVIITNKTPIDEAAIAAATSLTLIAVTATGHNVVDSGAARKRGIPVCNVPIYGTDSVAQHAIALLLELTNRVGRHEESVRQGEWSKSPDWSYAKSPVVELRDKTLGIIGFGRIGRQVAAIAGALGMKIKTYDIAESPTPDSLRSLFRESDVITIHCPLTKENDKFIDKTLLRHAKTGAFLINTSRGQLINEYDLAEALTSGTLGAAALDVLSIEPPPVNHPLLGLPNCLVTPHMAWLSKEARSRIMNTTLENVRCSMEGRALQNVVN